MTEGLRMAGKNMGKNEPWKASRVPRRRCLYAANAMFSNLLSSSSILELLFMALYTIC
jgi:hypothetical protein